MSEVDTSVMPPRQSIGDPVDRVDGRLKVTGGAKYSAEIAQDRLVHAYLVQSTTAAGQIREIDVGAAARSPGVLAILTHRNAPRLKQPSPPPAQGSGNSGDTKSGGDEKSGASGGGSAGKSGGSTPSAQKGGSSQGGEKSGGSGSGQSGGSEGRSDPFAKPYVLQDDKIRNFGQTVAVVIAESFEQARDAARLVRVSYRSDEPILSLVRNRRRATIPEKLLNPEIKPETQRGNFEQGWAEGEVQVDATYVTPNLHNNPMEPHATIAAWSGDQLTVYDSTQNVNGTQRNIAALFGLDPSHVRVIARFIGGGFGCKGPTWEHTIAAVMCAQVIKRPVKLVVGRQQMFPAVGYRPHTEQRLRLAAKRDGKLTAIAHEIFTPTNINREYIEPAGASTPMLYAVPHLHVQHRTVPLHWPRGTIMRAPGECAGVYPLECAMDELAYALKMDPIDLRRANEPSQDPEKKVPWSSRSLLACFEQGAKRFGWASRPSSPRSQREGRFLIGSGVATATYPANHRPASAQVKLTSEGGVEVQLAATDIGTGTYTALTQVAAEALQVPLERVKVEIGDTLFPQTPGSGGSWGASSYGSAVHEACLNMRTQLAALVREDSSSPLHGLNEGDLVLEGGRLSAKEDRSRGETYAAIVRRGRPDGVIAKADAKPSEERKQHSTHSFGAHFAEVRVNQDTGEARVSRYVGAFACGRILNAKTSHSQLVGGIIMGIGMALMEESILDERYGHFVNADLAEYHIPVNRDIPEIDIVMLEEHDPFVNPLGTKGLGEIGIVGAAAAVANAIYHATGKRVRDLPITPDKLLSLG